MKLRNLLFGTMIACAFASCSNEDDPISNVELPGEAEGPATLSIMVDKVQTKAGPADAEIASLNVLVFKGTTGAAAIEVNHPATSDEINTKRINKMPLTSGNKRVIVLANVAAEKVATATTYDAALALTKNFNDEGQVEVDGNLSMNSRVYDVTLSVSKDNCLGFTASTVAADNQAQVTGLTGVDVVGAIKLYRNVAKISINSIINAPAVNADKAYTDGKLTVKEVFLLHGKVMTKLVGLNGAEWGATEEAASNYINGAEMATYEGWVSYMQGKTEVYQYLTEVASYAKYDNYVALPAGGNEPNFTYEQVYGKSFYAYENTQADIYTLLVLKGDYTYKDVNDAPKTEYNRYYPVAVGKGITAGLIPANFKGLNVRGDNYSGVLRNLWYKIDLTIAGPGYATPFGPKPDGGDQPGDKGDTFLSVAYDVVEFGDVTQNGGTIE